MLSGPAKAAEFLDGFVRVGDPPKPILGLLQLMVQQENGLGPLEAADTAEKWLVRFRSRIELQLSNARQEGNFLSYDFNSSGDEFVQGSCFVEPDDDERVTAQKRSRSNQAKYLAYFSSLNPTQFEKLCGRVIKLLKVESAHVTKVSADQGIDFYGRLPLGQIVKPSEIAPGAEKNLTVWLVGQAKHYQKTHVSTKEIRELIGSVMLARSAVYAGSDDPLEGLDLRICDPVIFMFITTGRFTRDSRELLRKSGVVAMDGVQLSVFLADHRPAQGDGEFTLEELSEWLNLGSIG